MTTLITLAAVRAFKAAAKAPNTRGQLLVRNDGEALLTTYRTTDGTPAREFNGVDRAFPLPHALPARNLWLYVSSPEVQSLIARVTAGHSVAWDGYKHKGQLTDDAAAAADSLRATLANAY